MPTPRGPTSPGETSPAADVVVERRHKEAALDAVFRRAARERNVPAFLHGLVEELHRAYGASGVAAWLLEPPRPEGVLKPFAAVGLAETSGLLISGETAWLRSLLGSREPLIVHDLLDGSASGELTPLLAQGVRAIVLLPLGLDEELFGVLGLVWDRPLAAGDAAGLKSFAERASVTLGLVHLLGTVRESEEKHRSLIESAMDPIFILDAETGDILDCNRRAEEMAGAPRSALAQRKVWELQGPAGEAALRRLFKTAIERDGFVVRDVPFVRADGSLVRMDFSAAAVAFAGRRLIQAVARDVTELYRLQEQLRAHSDALERSVDEKTRALQRLQAHLVQSEKMAALGTLVAGVAHEINTPVGSIASNVQTAQSCCAKVREALDTAAGRALLAERPDLVKTLRILEDTVAVSRVASDRIAGIVRNLKNFVRLDEGELKTVDIHEGIESTLTLVRHEMKDRIKVVREFGEVPPIECFPNQINQVFMNLLINAAHAIRGEGTIHIRTYYDEPYVKVKIRDDGVGIEPEALERIFEPGFTTKPAGVGTGLGLSIVQRIVQDHCGLLSVESTPGQGATFTLLLPAKKC